MRVLLVDHDSEALETITRAIRGVLELDCVTSKGDALLLLRQNTYDVLIACERAVDGSGLDLLGRTTRTAVPLKRIFAAAPERLQLLGPRLAPFKVQRTINYPIDLEELWLAIAQVTSGPDDETDGTIERVVLDERGIPSNGSVPRSPIPPRPPAPLSAISTPAVAGAARGATARLPQAAPQLAPEPPPRAPAARTAPPVAAAAPAPRAPVPPRTPSDTGRMRAAQIPPPLPQVQTLAPMTASGPPDLPGWTPEMPMQDDFAQVAAQARFGVQQNTVDEASRRKRQRLLAASGIAVVVAGAIVVLIEKFYDPEARAREHAIAVEVTRMAEQQKVTDQLSLIEIEIENAIMNNDLDTARRELAQLLEQSPEHPRHKFLQASIDRAAEVARLSAQGGASAESKPAASQAAMLPSGNDRAATKARTPGRSAERGDGAAGGAPRRTAASRQRDNAASAPRTYGAPIGEVPRQSMPLNAPINSEPVTTLRRPESSFSGRTVEAGDPPVSRGTTASTPPVQAPNGAGTAVVPMPNSMPPAAQAPPAPVDVVPAKIVKRVTPVAPSNIPAKTRGHVVVRFDIGANGRVSNIEIVESQPQGVFDQAAQDAVRKWVYEPRKENGLAVDSSAKARLVFEAAN